MTVETLEPILTRHPFSRDLAPEHLRLLVGCAANVKFAAGQFVFREDGDADRVYLIREGQVALEAGGPTPLTILTLGGGEVLGWSWLFSPYRWQFDARVVEPTRVIALDATCLREKCEADHDFGYALMKQFVLMIVQRLHATRLQLLNAYDAAG